MTTFTLKYNDIVEKLARDMAISMVLPGDTNIHMFKSRLSQAKFRQAIDGKLDYECVYDGVAKTYTMTVVLQPPKAKASNISIVSINSKGAL